MCRGISLHGRQSVCVCVCVCVCVLGYVRGHTCADSRRESVASFGCSPVHACTPYSAHTHTIPIHLCTHICKIAKRSDAIVRTKARARVDGENESNSEGESEGNNEELWVEV